MCANKQKKKKHYLIMMEICAEFWTIIIVQFQ